MLIFDGLLIFLLCYHGRPLTLTERRGEKLRAGPAHVHTGGGGGGRREQGRGRGEIRERVSYSSVEISYNDNN